MEHIRNQTPYSDSNTNLYAAAASTEMQHMPGSRMQNNAGTNNLPFDQDRHYMPLKAEGQRQWDRDPPKGSNQMMSHPYAEGQEGQVFRSFYHGQIPDPKVDQGKLVRKKTSLQSQHEEDMEIGYEDKPTSLTYEILEKKFQDEILKLIKEQSDVEDAEIARHMEKIVEINSKFKEKLSWLRAQQDKRREDFLQKELQARLHQYHQHQHQQAGIGHQPVTNTVVPSGHPHGHKRAAVAELHPASYGNGEEFERYSSSSSSREQTPFSGGERGRGRVVKDEARVPYPPGRVYNKTSNSTMY